MRDFPKFEMPEFNIEEVMAEMPTIPVDKDIRLRTLDHAVSRGGNDNQVLRTASRFEEYIHHGMDGNHDEGTLDKVREVLMKNGYLPEHIPGVISDFQNAGILFRERRTDA